MASSVDDPGRDALWNAVESRWSEEVVHRAFLDYCAERGLLADAASRYREALGDAARAPVARRRLAEITVRAQAALPQANASLGPVVERINLVLLLVAVAVFVVLVAWALRKLL